jgi:hypothetical protein
MFPRSREHSRRTHEENLLIRLPHLFGKVAKHVLHHDESEFVIPSVESEMIEDHAEATAS